MQLFVRLPDEVKTRQGLLELNARIADPAEAEKITTRWQAFFRDLFRQVDNYPRRD